MLPTAEGGRDGPGARTYRYRGAEWAWVDEEDSVPIWLLIAVIGFVVIVLFVVIVVVARSRSQDSSVYDERHPEGYWTSLGISIGAGFGVPLGLVFDNLALGIAMGAGAGVVIGAALEQRNKENLRPLTMQELKARKWAIGLGLAVLALGVAVFVMLLLVRGS
jgi:uncharacterized membrane protein